MRLKPEPLLFFILIICGVIIHHAAYPQTVEKDARDHFPGIDSANIIAIDLSDVLKLVPNSNLQIKAFNAQYKLALARQSTVNQNWWPSINPVAMTAQYVGIAQNTDGTFIDVEKANVVAGLNIGVSWDFGDLFFLSQARKKQSLAAHYEYEATKNRQLLIAVQTYFDLAAGQAKVIALQEMFKRVNDLRAQLELMVEQGLRYKSDLLLAQASMNHTEIELSKSIEEMMYFSNRLRYLINFKENKIVLSKDNMLEPLELIDNITISKIDSAYDKRPEVMQALMALEGLKSEIKTTTFGLFIPKIQIFVYEDVFGPGFDSLGTRGILFSGLRWNIPLGEVFVGGNRRVYEAQIDYLKIQVEERKNNIRREILDAYSGVVASRKRIDLSMKSIEFTQGAYNQSMDRQRLGTSTPLELFHAQEKFIEAELDYIQSVADYNKSQFALFVALGNGL